MHRPTARPRGLTVRMMERSCFWARMLAISCGRKAPP